MSSPFNEQKYKCLLEGLEVSEVLLSEIKQINNIFRIDAEYFKKQYLLEDKSLSKFHIETLGNLSFITDGQHGYHEINELSEIRMLTAKNAKGFFANDTNADRIAKWVDDKNKRSSLEKDDLILSTRGTVGLCAIIDADVLPANIDQDVARIKLYNDMVLPNVLMIFLNSKLGQHWLFRNQTGMVQQGIALWRLKEMPIPVLPKVSQNKIDELVCNARISITQSQILYRQAEELLIETLGLKDFQPSQEGINIKTFKNSFLTTGRLDAEYYQPKYEEIINMIKLQNHDTLGNLVNIKKSIEPGSDVYSDEGIPFLRVADYNKMGISEPEKKLSPSFYKENKTLIDSLKPKKDTILFSKDGSVGTAFLVRKNEDFITSGAILHLSVKDINRINSEYLTLVLNSKVVQMQAERDAGGSIILHWRKEEIENVVVPIVSTEIQQQIATLVSESFALRDESERLLQEAKEMVEREIEK